MATPKKKRLRGTGAIVKQASGNFAFQFHNAKGKRVTRSLKTKNRKEADAKAKEFERGLTARDVGDVLHEIGRARALIDTKPLPMSEVWSAFLDTKPSAGSGTLALYLRCLDDFITWTGIHCPSLSDFSQVEEDTAESWLASVWARGISASTYNDRRGALCLIHKKLSKPYKWGKGPWLDTERKDGVQQKRMPLTQDQMESLMALKMDKESRAILCLGLYAGMRLGDAVYLKVESISDSVLVYTPAKTSRTSGAIVEVPVLPIVADALKPFLARKRDGDCFPEAVELYNRNPDSLKKRVLDLIHLITGKGEQQKETGQSLRKRALFGFHSLRHSFATEAARAGVKSAYLQLITGDTLQTLEKYYVHIAKVGVSPSPEFELLARLVSPDGNKNPKREELKRLAEDLPIRQVEELIALANTKIEED
mgnify:CR=1 FL=1